MVIFKKDGTAVLFVMSLMVIAMLLSSCQAAIHFNLHCADLPKCTEHECMADCHRRGFQVGVGLVDCMDGRPDQCCCRHGLLHHPDDKLTTN
ncbi:hypothetical protein OsI_37843 [Oryza sativa Indica Group]|uniref:Uncharacterized protein n=1 Tax=Oryza sativa subsp. indica TaxID=39946 RepID=B8BNP2_ORYSI|nr:hypothetical protein OsI_37843 [Oryza sativa Indica Group]